MDLFAAFEHMKQAALDAGKLIMDVYHTNFAVEIKQDDSPVTAADKGSDALIRKELGTAFPEAAFLTEESTDDRSRLDKEWLFVVDPLDGTSDFVSRAGEFAVLIALVHYHEPVVGVIYAPNQNLFYYAIKGEGAYRLDGDTPVRLHVSSRVGKDLRCLVSRSHFNEKEKAYIEARRSRFSEIVPMGAALKFAKIAEGSAEISYRFSGGTKEWDVAPGNLILEEAGGIMVKPDGSRYSYNREDVYNREGYILANCLENLEL